MPKSSWKTLSEYLMVLLIGIGLVAFGVWAVTELLKNKDMAHQLDSANINIFTAPIIVLVGVACMIAAIQLIIKRRILPEKQNRSP